MQAHLQSNTEWEINSKNIQKLPNVAFFLEEWYSGLSHARISLQSKNKLLYLVPPSIRTISFGKPLQVLEAEYSTVAILL